MGHAYFAYGSNLDPAVMDAWCPGHRPMGPARLPGHAFRFDKYAKRWGGGVADVVPADGEDVWGVLYEVDDAGVAALDRKELAGVMYQRVDVEVSRDGASHEAFTYRVLQPDTPFVPPPKAYVATILRGLSAHDVPVFWAERVRRVASKGHA